MWRSICAVRLSASRNERFTNALKEWERQAWKRCIILCDSLKSDWWRNNNTFLHSPASRLSQTREKIRQQSSGDWENPHVCTEFFHIWLQEVEMTNWSPKVWACNTLNHFQSNDDGPGRLVGGNLTPNSCCLIQADCNHSQTDQQRSTNNYSLFYEHRQIANMLKSSAF